jgi:hypothetical protein
VSGYCYLKATKEDGFKHYIGRTPGALGFDYSADLGKEHFLDCISRYLLIYTGRTIKLKNFVLPNDHCGKLYLTLCIRITNVGPTLGTP